MQLDIDRLVAYFGGVNALAEALKQHDPENAATTAAIYKWRTRGSLPLAQLQKLTALAEAQGRPLDLNAFLQKNESLERTEMTQTNRVIIFDTTMRDGEQSPGASMTKEEKIRIARQLEKMGVDVIEAGFAAASPGDFESVNAIAKIITKSTVCSLARAVENDVRKAGEAVSPAPKKRIHTFIATSPIHMEHKLKMKPQQVIDAAVKAVKLPKNILTMWNFPPKTPCVRIWTFSPKSLRRLSRQAQPPSIFPILSATPSLPYGTSVSVTSSKACPTATK